MTNRKPVRDRLGALGWPERFVVCAGQRNRYTVPGFKAQKTWQGLPWEILWTKTQDEDLARLMMGLMAMHAFIIHHDNWAISTTQYAGHVYTNRYYTKFSILPNGERRYFDEPEEQTA